MISDERSVLISIRPRFADAIMKAEKTVELRRTRINVPAGTCFLVYSTSPVMVVIGSVVLRRVESDTPNRLWAKVRHLAEVTKTEYHEYFNGSAEAFAFHLSDPDVWETPVPLSQLREIAGIEPGQSFRYLDGTQIDLITPSRVAVGSAASC